MKNKSSAFITDKNYFEKQKIKTLKVLNGKKLPSNIFSTGYCFFKILEFHELFSQDFYNYYSTFVKKLGYDYFTFYTLEPNPEEYFFKFFNKFSVLDFSVEEDFSFFLNKLTTEPKESPADALIYNSNEIIIYSQDLRLFIYGNREEELGMIVSKDEDLFKEFIRDYPKTVSLYDMKDFLKTLVPLKFSNASFAEKQVSFYNALIDNYDR